MSLFSEGRFATLLERVFNFYRAVLC